MLPSYLEEIALMPRSTAIDTPTDGKPRPGTSGRRGARGKKQAQPRHRRRPRITEKQTPRRAEARIGAAAEVRGGACGRSRAPCSRRGQERAKGAQFPTADREPRRV